MGDRRGKALEPQRRDRAAGARDLARRDGRSDLGRQMRRARHVAAGAHGGGHRRDRPRRLEATDQHRRLGLRPGQHLDRHLGQDGERAPGTRHQLAEVVAGDVLHHPAAGLEDFAAAGHRGEAEEVVACGAGLDPARAGQVRRQRAADGAAAAAAAEDGAIVHRLEGELLALGGDERLDLGKRRTGVRREHQLRGLIERDAGERGEVERQIGLRRPADRALRAMADDLGGLALRQRPLHRLLDGFRVMEFERIGHRGASDLRAPGGGRQSNARGSFGAPVMRGEFKTSADSGTEPGRHGRACGRARRSGAASGTPCRD